MADVLTILMSAKPASEVLAGVRSDDMTTSMKAGQAIVREAKNAKLSLPDYLRLAVKPELDGKLDGFEASLAFLNLPVREDMSQGVLLQAAAESFTTYPGTRALFPAVIDNVVQWKYRQDQIENVANIVAQSRTVNGIEMITTVVDDKPEDYQQTGVIAETARIPIRSLRTSEKGVKFYKFGGGFEFSYEFERRASLELITPYANRIQREVEIGQTAVATAMLINGDGVSAAAPVTLATDLAASMPTDGRPVPKTGRLNWEIFLAWLVSRARANAPIDTIVGNWDMFLEWKRMFATPTANLGPSQIEILQKAGVNVNTASPALDLNVNFALSSTAPAGTLVGFVKNETLEELVENGSEIEESVRAIENQVVRYVKTTNKGYRLVFADTRSVLSLNQ